MNSKRKCLENSRLYAITDAEGEDPALLEKITFALQGGADIVQLRSKVLSDRKLLTLGAAIRKITNELGKLLIVNDRVDLALALGADGVHLGQEDLPLSDARRCVRDQDFLIGKSTHSIDQAVEAEEEGADYIGYGPIFPTPTKPTYSPVGLESIKAVTKKVSVPVVCIGGIDATNLLQVIQAGAKRVAIVRAIFAAADTFEAARRLKRILEGELVSEARMCRTSFRGTK